MSDKISFTYEEAAKATGMSTMTLRRAVENGDLVARRVSARVVVFHKDELDQWLKSRPAA